MNLKYATEKKLKREERGTLKAGVVEEREGEP